MKTASIHRRPGEPTIGGYFCYAGRTKPSTFIRPTPRSALLSPCVSSKFYFIDRRAHQTINVAWFPRETRPLRVIRLCNIIVGSRLLPHPRGGMEWSTIAVLRGSGTREGTSRKLNTSIFSMFTVEESLFNHGNVEWRIKKRESQKCAHRYTIRHDIDRICDINSVMRWANEQSNNSFNYLYIARVIYTELLLAYIEIEFSLNEIKWTYHLWTYHLWKLLFLFRIFFLYLFHVIVIVIIV